MLEGVKIIAERIREFPEEIPKWKHFLNTQLSEMLTEEEHAHIKEAFYEADRKDFNARVLDCLNDNDPKIRYKAEERYATGWTDPRTAISPFTFSKAQIQAEGQPIQYK